MTNIELVQPETTGRVIKAFYRVYDELGYGFLEKVYCGALETEFTREQLGYQREHPIDVFYRGGRVGHYRADFLVQSRIIVEVKASRVLDDADRKQLLNNLRATRIELGLLLHFGPAPTFKRIYLENNRKPGLEVVA
jgi:GxxExxY protein